MIEDTLAPSFRGRAQYSHACPESVLFEASWADFWASEFSTVLTCRRNGFLRKWGGLSRLGTMAVFTPRGVPSKTRGQDGFATSFPAGLLPPLQHAGLVRRTRVARQSGVRHASESPGTIQMTGQVFAQTPRGLCSVPTKLSTFGNCRELRGHRQKEAGPSPSPPGFSSEVHSRL